MAADHCQNPAQLRAWVRAKTGLDLPFRANPAPSIQLIDAQMIEGTHGVKIVYRYSFKTPLRNLVSFLPGASLGYLDFSWSNVMRMEPIL